LSIIQNTVPKLVHFRILSEMSSRAAKTINGALGHLKADDHPFQMTERSIIFVDSALLPMLFLPDVSWD
jgi:hypothetical protein